MSAKAANSNDVEASMPLLSSVRPDVETQSPLSLENTHSINAVEGDIKTNVVGTCRISFFVCSGL